MLKRKRRPPQTRDRVTLEEDVAEVAEAENSKIAHIRREMARDMLRKEKLKEKRMASRRGDTTATGEVPGRKKTRIPTTTSTTTSKGPDLRGSKSLWTLKSQLRFPKTKGKRNQAKRISRSKCRTSTTRSKRSETKLYSFYSLTFLIGKTEEQ